MNTFLRDLRYAVRMLAKRPGFTIVAVLTLAIGIGATTAIFSVVNAVLLRPLPYKEPDRLVQFWETNPLKGWTENVVAPANYLDWQSRSESFESMSAYFGSQTRDVGPSNFYLTGDGEPERLKGLGVTGEFFSVLGIEPLHGRGFRPEETWQGNYVVVLSHGLWQRRFGGDPAIVGQTISLNGRPQTVIGIMPESFYFPTREIELWSPLGMTREQMTQLRRPHFLRAIARLKPGVSLEQAQAEMTRIASDLEQQYPDTNTQMGVGVGTQQEWYVEKTRPMLLIFIAAVGFVLLIACVNVANLMLARAATRAKEIAIRTALGASRWRIVRQLLTESLMLAVTGGALGLLLAVWARDLLLAFSPGNIYRFDEISLDLRAVAFTFGVTLLTSLMFGLFPALRISKPDLTATLKEGQKGAGGSRGVGPLKLLVIAEIALSLVPVVGAGLLIKSFLRLQEVDPGIDPNNVLTFRIALPGIRYKEDDQYVRFFRQLDERIRTLPGVEDVGASTAIAFKTYNWTGDLTVEGRDPENYFREVRHKEITPSYFRTMRLHLEAGREFNESDNANSPPVTIVNQALADQYFPGEEVLGRRVKFSKPTIDSPWYTIIGIVEGEKQDGLDAAIKPEVYQSYLQYPLPQMTFVVRTSNDPNSLIGAVRGEIRGLDKDLPAFDIATMQEIVTESLAQKRFTMLLLAIFGSVALLLSAIGIYGVMSYSVTERTHEIGVRMALGAAKRDVLKLVVGQAAVLAMIGVGCGLVASSLLMRLMESLLFRVSTTDPPTFLIVSVVLTAVALVASYLPARRAMRVDPMIALRYE
ncbi:MAG TPA: ABC transporter permease [Blastocatellia bacterium]|nr:ABC transporter permease [Blastocatellia bacterium]